MTKEIASPFAAMKAFVEDSLDEQAYVSLIAAAPQELRHQGLLSSEAAQAIFSSFFGDTAVGSIDTLNRLLTLRTAIDYYIWSLTDETEIAYSEEFFNISDETEAEHPGMRAYGNKMLANRQRLTSLAQRALPKWQSLREAEASFSAIKLQSLSRLEPLVEDPPRVIAI